MRKLLILLVVLGLMACEGEEGVVSPQSAGGLSPQFIVYDGGGGDNTKIIFYGSSNRSSAECCDTCNLYPGWPNYTMNFVHCIGDSVYSDGDSLFMEVRVLHTYGRLKFFAYTDPQNSGTFMTSPFGYANPNRIFRRRVDISSIVSEGDSVVYWGIYQWEIQYPQFDDVYCSLVGGASGAIDYSRVGGSATFSELLISPPIGGHDPEDPGDPHED